MAGTSRALERGIAMDYKLEKKYPHHADVLEREYSDGGFSRGWAMHAKPVPARIFDCHIHYNGGMEGTILENIAADETMAKDQDVSGAMVFLHAYGNGWQPNLSEKSIMDQFPYFTLKELEKRMAGFAESSHTWAAYLNHLSPEPDLVDAVADMGCCCIKLHNAPVIENNIPADMWLSKEWSATFEAIQRRGLAVIKHVTQRLSPSLYTGAGRNSYWKTGWQKGVTYTNEDLLQSFLTCCRRFPEINFIGAHQLHLGWERLDELFTEYPNLYIDTSVGCQLKQYDHFYPHDKDYLRKMFIRHADRILFGTDNFWGCGDNGYKHINNLQHIRYVMALDLPQAVLDLVFYKNAERLLGA